MEKFEKKLKEAEEKIAKADKKKPEPEKEKAIKFTLKPGSAKAKKTNEEKDGDKASLKETADDHEENDK